MPQAKTTRALRPADEKLLAELCALPTAAFLEDRVYEYVDAWAAKRGLDVERDRFGNRLLSVAGTNPRRPRLVLVAHTDHPAFVWMGDGRAEFRGGVRADHLTTAAVRFFTPDGEVVARVKEVEEGDRQRLQAATFDLRQGLPRGTIGLIDEGEPHVRDGIFHSRICDDLAGCASAMAALDELRRKPAESTLAVLLTRAEEVGFVGAIAAARQRSGGLLRDTDRIISIETSNEQPHAPIGNGAVLRVGDHTSIFHSAFSYFLARRADELLKRKDGLMFQRALMPGGSCEGSVFDAYGYVTGAVCVPLGNYHNMDRRRKRTGAEYISLNDWRSMVALFVDATRHLHTFDATHRDLRKRLDDRLKQHRRLLRRPTEALHAAGPDDM